MKSTIRLTFILAIYILFMCPSAPLMAQGCWSPLGSGVGQHFDVQPYINATITYNGQLIVAGRFDTVGGAPGTGYIAAWDGTNWSALGNAGITYSQYVNNTEIKTLAVYNGELYAAGFFDTVGGLPVKNIARWNGTRWSDVGGGLSTQIGDFLTINTLCVYNGALYAGGIFEMAGSVPVRNIAKWDGSAWSSVSTGVGMSAGHQQGSAVQSMAVYNYQLCVAGFFDTVGSTLAHNIALWNGNVWSAMDSGVSSNVYTMTTYQGYLYIAGNFNTPGLGIAKWDGSAWSALTSTVNYDIDGLCVYNGDLIVSGEFTQAGSVAVNGLARWNGTTWSDVDGGVGPMNSFFHLHAASMDTLDGRLYVSGFFSQAGSITAFDIASYAPCATDGTTYIDVPEVIVYPNPASSTLIISGLSGHSSSLVILNQLGEVVSTQGLTNQTSTSIDISSLTPGLYIVACGEQRAKVVKE